MSISESITALKSARVDIADAIEEKGVQLGPSDGFLDFAAAVRAIVPPSNYGLITFSAVDPTRANIMVS